jgi:hypothetical protein
MLHAVDVFAVAIKKRKRGNDNQIQESQFAIHSRNLLNPTLLWAHVVLQKAGQDWKLGKWRTPPIFLSLWLWRGDGRLWQLAKQCYALAKDTLLPEAQRALQDIGAKYEQQADELRRIAITRAEYPKDKKTV